MFTEISAPFLGTQRTKDPLLLLSDIIMSALFEDRVKIFYRVLLFSMVDEAIL